MATRTTELISDEEFSKLKLRLARARFSEKSILAARLVLVEGKTNSAAAELALLSRQAVGKIIDRVLLIIREVPAGWVPVNTFAPPDEARLFLDRVAKARSEIRD